MFTLELPKRYQVLPADSWTIALEGCDVSPDAMRRAFTLLADWYARAGIDLDRICWSSVDNKEKRQGTIKRMRAKLETRGFEGLRCVETRHTIDEGPYENAGFMIHFSERLIAFYALVEFTGSQGENLLALARELIVAAKPVYGLVYSAPWKSDPLYYAIGLPCGFGDTLEERQDGKQISHWFTARKERLIQKGTLRGIYPMNFLTDAHLDKPVGDRSFREWITEARGYRGTLEEFTPGVWLWRVKEKWMEEVQEPLRSAGFLFDYRVYERIAPAREAVDGPP